MLRLGKHPWARDWAGENEPDISMTMVFWPGIGACLLAIGVAFLGDGTWWAGLIMGVMLPVGVVLMLWGGLRIQVPAWFLPAWSRDGIRSRRSAQKRSKR
jgi:hypothetical protein